MLRADCRDAAEYAEMIIDIGHWHRDPESMFLELGKRMIDIFFDQERQGLDLRGDGSAFRSLEMYRYDVSLAIQPGRQDIAKQQAALVSGECNRPPRSTVPRESQAQILTFETLPFDPNPGQHALPLVEEIPVVCLYSGGLDSAAGLASSPCP